MTTFLQLNNEINNFCQGCLETNYIKKADSNINFQFIKLLKLNSDVKVSNDTYLCVYCVAQIKKLFKFVDQCIQINNTYFHMYLAQKTKPQSTYFSLSQSQVINISYPDTKIEVCDDNGQNDFDDGAVSDDDEVPLISLKDNEIKNEMEDDYKINQKDTKVIFMKKINDQKNKPQSTYFSLSQSQVMNISYPDTKIEISDDNGQNDFDDGAVSDDDEVPLISLKDNEIKNEMEDDYKIYQEDTKEIIIENFNDNYIETIKKEQLESIPKSIRRSKKKKKKHENYQHNKTKKKKILREGFSSRMVQETEEYIVIKLSTEEVLEEMRVKAKSNKYLGAPYKCDKCVLGFNHEDVLQNHMEKHIMKDGTVMCEICSQYWPPGVSMRGHTKSHSTRYKCRACANMYRSRQNLLEHFSQTHSGGGTIYNCTQCSFFTSKRTMLQKHVYTHKTAGLQYSCDKCGRLLKNKDSLRVHMARHDKSFHLKCSECSQRFSNKYLLNKHQTSHQTNREGFYCVECDVSFRSRVSLMSHFKRTKAHRSPGQVVTHKCKQCGLSLESLSALTEHAAAAHGADVRVSCDVCHKQFSSAATLRAHVRDKHAEHSARPRRICTCDLCGHTFTNRSVLAKHIRTHTGERPYACAECGLCFAQHGTRYTHIRIVHKKLPRSTKKAKEQVLGAS